MAWCVNTNRILSVPTDRPSFRVARNPFLGHLGCNLNTNLHSKNSHSPIGKALSREGLRLGDPFARSESDVASADGRLDANRHVIDF